MQYRHEIDGLRALAVLPVIFFHAGFQTFSGGFVGVDVFFVISGYLITTILLTELKSGNFSLVRFYERRARRIMPALFVVMAACLPFAWLWMLPSEMKQFANSVQAVTIFGSNILFWGESGYFETAAELKPLLHTWSLAVEEQFYVFFPVFLLFTWRFGRRTIIATLLIILLVSLALAHWNVLNNLSANFFLLPTRAWELALGAIIAFSLANSWLDVPNRVAQFLSLLGLLLICYSVFTFSKVTPFPGGYALIPTVGTALVILFASHQTLAGRVLSSKLLVPIGLVSYSAYLWHQPLFAFTRHRSIHEPSVSTYLALIVITLILATLSWRYVEQPFRQKDTIERKNIFLFALAGSVLFLILGTIGHLTDGYYFRDDLKQKMHDVEYRTRINFGLNKHCNMSKVDFSAACSTNSKPEVLLWGDSYAMHLADALVASNPSIKLIQATASSCGPIIGIAHGSGMYSEEWARKCISNNDQVLEYARNTKSLKFAVISSPFGYISNPAVRTRSGEIVHGQTVALAAFLKTLEALKGMGIKPIVVSPPPRSGQDIGHCLVKAMLHGYPQQLCDFSYGHAISLHRPVLEFLTEIEKEFNVVWLSDAICDAGVCHASIGDTFIYRDSGHLSKEGSSLIGIKIDLYNGLAEKSRYRHSDSPHTFNETK